MATLAELLKQKEELEKKIEAARSAERDGVVKQIVEMCNAHGIKLSHLKPHMTKPRAKKGATA